MGAATGVRKRKRWFGEQERFMLLLLAPSALLLLLFQVLPIAIGANASFRDWMLTNPKGTWLGWQHYVEVLTDPAFLTIVLPNTFGFMLATVTVSLVLGLSLALLLNRPYRGQKIVQTVLLLPLMVATPCVTWPCPPLPGKVTSTVCVWPPK